MSSEGRPRGARSLGYSEFTDRRSVELEARLCRMTQDYVERETGVRPSTEALEVRWIDCDAEFGGPPRRLPLTCRVRYWLPGDPGGPDQ